MIVMFLLVLMLSGQQRNSTPTIKATWTYAYGATLEEEAQVERGSKEVPLQASTCDGKFRIESMHFSMDDTKGEMRLRVVVTKLFSGRGPAPRLLIEYVPPLSPIKGPLTDELTFDSVDVNRWPQKGYKLSVKSDVTTAPETWTRVTLVCQ